MKKQLLISLSAIILFASSCGVSSKAPQTHQDTAAYAIGIIMGSNAVMSIDSTVNTDLIIQGAADAFATDNKQANANAKAYMLGLQIGESARQIDSTFSIEVIAEGVRKSANQSAFMTTQESDAYIINYMQNKGQNEAESYLTEIDGLSGVDKTSSGLRYKIELQGEGKVNSTDTVMVHYTLYDYNDNSLDSSVLRDEPLRVTLPGGVVPGFAEGLQLIGKGGKAIIWMPSDLGYGDRGTGNIKPHQALKFEIEVVEVIPAK